MSEIIAVGPDHQENCSLCNKHSCPSCGNMVNLPCLRPECVEKRADDLRVNR